MSETSEIIREARKAGMQTAIMLFAALVLVLIAFLRSVWLLYPQEL